MAKTFREFAATVLFAAILLVVHVDASGAVDRVPARADFGDTQLAAIKARYEAAPDDCGGSNQPAVLCSGVLIRITGGGVGYHVWNPSEGSVTRGGVSFSYLRADSNFSGLAWTDLDGLIFSPEQESYGATVYPATICAFPLDAHTWGRPDRGCGPYSNLPAGAPCQSQGIFTAAEWLAHYLGVGSQNSQQCGFTTIDIPDTAPAFLASLHARDLLPPSSFATHNELMLATWAQDIGASLPIQAFFYLTENGNTGLAGAQRNQRDLLGTDGIAVPIIHVSLPPDATGQAAFAFTPAEQAIEAPALPGSLDLPPSLPLAPLGALRLQDILDHPDVEVRVPPMSGIRGGDVGRIRWTGTQAIYETPPQTLAAGSIATFHVPRGTALATLGQQVAVSFLTVSAAPAAIERVSPIQLISVQTRPLDLPPPVVGTGRRYVSIDYPSMATGDRVLVTYEGEGTYTVPHLVGTPGPFAIGLSPDWLEGPPGRVRYTVQPNGEDERYLSPDAIVGMRPFPLVRDAANGWLDVASLTVDPVVAVPPWEGIAPGQRVWLDAVAYSPDGTEQKDTLIEGITVDAVILRDGVRASLPRAWLSRLPDGSAVFVRMRSGASLPLATAFPITRLTVRNVPGPMVTKPLPRLVDLRADGSVMPFDGLFAPSALQGEPQVRVSPWPGMAVGQRLWLRIHGRRSNGDDISVELATGRAVTDAELDSGLVDTVPRDMLALLPEGSPMTVELKVGFEKFDDEGRALAFPLSHLGVGK